MHILHEANFRTAFVCLIDFFLKLTVTSTNFLEFNLPIYSLQHYTTNH